MGNALIDIFKNDVSYWLGVALACFIFYGLYKLAGISDAKHGRGNGQSSGSGLGLVVFIIACGFIFYGGVKLGL